MIEIFNYFINTDNINADDKKYNFNYKLGHNIFLKENEELYFKLVNFSMMNSMLNVSSTHNNNQFKINNNGVILTITIPDGNYSVSALRDKINDLVFALSLPVALNYEPLINKYYWACNASNVSFMPLNMKLILGFSADNINLNIGDTYADKFANLLSYTKIILASSSLVFIPTTDNNLVKKYSANESINEIIAWFDKDIPTFTTINWENLSNAEYKLANNNISYVNFLIMNEYKEIIKDCPNCFIQFQLIIKSYNNVEK